jgi:broad specificity phosphatase PhoE
VTAVLLRHASAGDRLLWTGDDRLRPLDARGRRQSAKLVPLLLEVGVERVVSSPYVRCVETVEPLAAALGVELEHDDRLAEGSADAAADLLRQDGVVACTHGDVIVALLGELLKKAAAAVVEPDGDGTLRIVSQLRPHVPK